MDNTQFLILIITLLATTAGYAGLITWFRAESREDWRHMDAKMNANLSAINSEMKDFKSEMKDFHGRLCTLEERYLNWVMRDK